MYICAGAPQRHEIQRSDQNRKLLYLLDKETICEELTRQNSRMMK